MNNEQTMDGRTGLLDQYENEENNRLTMEAQVNEMLAKKKAQQAAAQPKLKVVTFGLMLGVAILFDVICFVMNLLPIIGGVLEDVTVTPVAIITFWLWCKISGINMSKGGRGVIIAIISIAGFIPILNALPKWSAEVLILRLFTLAEYGMLKSGGKLGKLPGIKKLTGK